MQRDTRTQPARFQRGNARGNETEYSSRPHQAKLSPGPDDDGPAVATAHRFQGSPSFFTRPPLPPFLLLCVLAHPLNAPTAPPPPQPLCHRIDPTSVRTSVRTPRRQRGLCSRVRATPCDRAGIHRVNSRRYRSV